MRRMLIVTIAGGAAAAYFAYPYGFLASSLAYVLGGMLFALLGLSSFLIAWRSKKRRDRAPAISRDEARNTSSAYRKADA